MSRIVDPRKRPPISEDAPGTRTIVLRFGCAMNDIEFFRDNARQCRNMARRAATDYVRWQLLLWAREFDRIAAEDAAQGPRRSVESWLARFRRKQPPELDAAD